MSFQAEPRRTKSSVSYRPLVQQRFEIIELFKAKETTLQNSSVPGFQYLKRKLAGLCAFAGCPAKAEVGHTRCAKHLVLMCQKQKAQYESEFASLSVFTAVNDRGFGVFVALSVDRGFRRILCRWEPAEPCDSIARRKQSVTLNTRKLRRDWRPGSFWRLEILPASARGPCGFIRESRMANGAPTRRWAK